MCRHFQAEGGVTEFSLQNDKLLREKHGTVTHVHLTYDPQGEEEYQTHVTYADGYSFVFTGFSWGYYGTGPTGLVTWAERNGIPNLSREQVARLRKPDIKFDVWSWTTA